jgi:hypothetical protein
VLRRLFLALILSIRHALELACVDFETLYGIIGSRVAVARFPQSVLQASRATPADKFMRLHQEISHLTQHTGLTIINNKQ